MQKIYASALLCIFLFLAAIKGVGQVSLTNASPSFLINFSNTTPSSVGTSPQTAFTGAGFSPDPVTAGRLNSNAWAITGWTDGALTFGGANTSGDFARGAVSTPQTTGGMYAYTGAPGSAANPTLMIQPGNSDFAPGTLTLRIQNNGTTNITALAVSYNLYVRNDQGRSNSFNFSHSADNSTYTPVAALDYTSTAVADASPAWALVGSAPSRSTTISGLNILPGGVYYIRWSGADVGGSNSRDEFGLDDINVNATYVPPVAGAALNFDGIDDRVNVTNSTANLANSSFSVEMWLKRGAGGTDDFVFSQGGGIGNNETLHIGFRDNGNFTFAFYGDDLNIAGLSDLVWHHWACTFDNITKIQKVYRDGVLVGQRTATSSFLGSGNSNLVIGVAAYGSQVPNFYTGDVDEIRVWNRTLCQAEITNKMNCEIPATATGLLANYHFNQGVAGASNTTETTLTDASGNNNNGTLTNFALTGATSNWVAPGGVTSGTSCAALPTVSINDISLAEGNAPGSTNFTFIVQLSSPAPVGGVNVAFQTANGTAMSGSDYTITSGTVTIAQGSTTGTISVPVTGDNNNEPDETFVVNLSNACNATISDAQGQATIQNDDAATLITYYPRTNATDLSQPSQWTTDPAGAAGTSAPNFTSPNQLFNLNTNVANPAVSSAWTFSGGSNLVLNNTASLTFGPAASLTIATGSAADFNGKPVTLKSIATGTAFIGQITGLLSNATNVTVERYLSSNNNRAYRLLAPSVNTITAVRANWQENGGSTTGLGTHISGSTTGANGFDITQTGIGSLFTYDAATPAWQYITNTNVNTLNAKSGYLIYIRGDRTIDLNSTASTLPSNTTTLRATGALLTGTQSFTGLTGNSGFSLVTNPYAAPVNWVSVHGASTALTSSYTLWDPNIGSQGGYVTVSTAGVKSNASSNATVNIQSGQAFFIQASGAAAPVVNVAESHKSTVNNIDIFRLGNQTEMFTTSLFYTDGAGARINADGVTSVFENSYSADIDGNDAAQIANWDEDIAISRGSSALSIESRPLIDTRDTIRFTITRLKVQNYEWEFGALNFLHPNLNASLVDNFLGTKTPINLSGTTVVSFAVTTNSASSAADRFMVVFEPNTVLPVSLSSVKAYQKGKDVQVEWTVQTEVNMQRYEVEKSADGRVFSKMSEQPASGAATYNSIDVAATNGDNFYRIKALGKTGQVQYSKVVRVNLGKTGNEISLYPNPVPDNEVSLSVNLPKGNYTLILTGALGQTVLKKSFVHLGGAATQTLQLESGLAKGVYQLRVSDGKQSYTQPLIKN